MQVALPDGSPTLWVSTAPDSGLQAGKVVMLSVAPEACVLLPGD